MDAEERILALENPELTWPLAGSFADMRNDDDAVAEEFIFEQPDLQ